MSEQWLTLAEAMRWLEARGEPIAESSLRFHAAGKANYRPRLEAEKRGGIWFVTEASLEAFLVQRSQMRADRSARTRKQRGDVD